MKVNYEYFKKLAQQNELTQYEKIGFSDSCRKGLESIIFQELLTKLNNLTLQQKTILDIGPGCSDLPRFLMDLCEAQQHILVFCDSEEMLSFHPKKKNLFKIPGMFPETFDKVLQVATQYDVILCYSVFQYIFIDTNVWDFIDKCLKLLKPKGQFLIGDIPNLSKRKRFFLSEEGIKYHKKFMKTNNNPEVIFNTIEAGNIDDAIIMSLMMRVQAAGFDVYLMPQGKELPLSNRRVDILIVKP